MNLEVYLLVFQTPFIYFLIGTRKSVHDKPSLFLILDEFEAYYVHNEYKIIGPRKFWTAPGKVKKQTHKTNLGRSLKMS